MTSRVPVDLDVVVLGGGGHVGLPLSLSFAEAVEYLAGRGLGVTATARNWTTALVWQGRRERFRRP